MKLTRTKDGSKEVVVHGHSTKHNVTMNKGQSILISLANVQYVLWDEDDYSVESEAMMS